MIHTFIYTSENINKSPTPANIAPNLQAIIINNNPFTPLLKLQMHMPTHQEDVHLIQEIKD